MDIYEAFKPRKSVRAFEENPAHSQQRRRITQQQRINTMKITDFDGMPIREVFEFDEAPIRCPVCGVVWYDPIKTEDLQLCPHLRFTLNICSKGELFDEGYGLTIHGKWNAKAFQARIKQALKSTPWKKWRKTLCGIKSPRDLDAIYRISGCEGSTDEQAEVYGFSRKQTP